MTLLPLVPQVSLPQSVLLAHGVFRLFTFGLLPSVSEVALAVPAAIETSKEECQAEVASNKEGENKTADTPLTGAAFTHFIPFSKKTGTIVTGDLLPR